MREHRACEQKQEQHQNQKQNQKQKHGGDLRGGDMACARGEAECWFLLIMLLSPSASPVEALWQPECSNWQGRALPHCQMERAYWERTVLGANSGALDVCVGRPSLIDSGMAGNVIGRRLSSPYLRGKSRLQLNGAGRMRKCDGR